MDNMDREISPEKIRRQRLKSIAKVGTALVLVVVAIVSLTSLINPSVDKNKLTTAFAERGSIEAVVTATGTIIPKFEQVITSPIQTSIDAVLKESGDEVTKGQSILKLNDEFIQLNLSKLQDELALQKNQKEQLSYKLERSRIDLQAEYDIKEMQTQFIASQLERTGRLYEIGGVTKEGYERDKLNLEIANRELNQLNSKIENQQASLTADVEELNIKIRIQENKICEAVRQIELAKVKAENDGVITWVNDNLGATVNPGEIIARIANLGSFKVEASISDIHANKLQVGGLVRIRVGENDIGGSISSINPAMKDGIASFVVNLAESSHETLRSNLRVDVFVITSIKQGVIRVKNGDFFNGKNNQRVYVIKDDIALCHVVDIGATNYDFVELVGDIEDGDEVIISDMKNHSHLDEIKIKPE